MAIALFQVVNKDGKSHFFQQTFLVANINMNVAFRISSFTLSNPRVNFNNQELHLRSYIVSETVAIIKWVE